MATYPIKMLKDEEGTPFVPLVSTDCIRDENNQTLQQVLDKKLSPTNLLAGDYVSITPEGNNCYINVDLPANLNVINNLTTASAGQGALDAYQGKVLKDSIPQVVNDLSSTSTTSALSANQGRLLNDTLHTVDDYMHALRTGIYMRDTNGGALITFDNAKLYNMIQVKLWGNGYGDIPIDTIIQGYHYQSLGNFINSKQHNNSANLGACKWKIVNGKIALWVPCLGYYSSLVIDAYETLPTVRPIPNTVELMDTEPAGDVSITCTIV